MMQEGRGQYVRRYCWWRGMKQHCVVACINQNGDMFCSLLFWVVKKRSDQWTVKRDWHNLVCSILNFRVRNRTEKSSFWGQIFTLLKALTIIGNKKRFYTCVLCYNNCSVLCQISHVLPEHKIWYALLRHFISRHMCVTNNIRNPQV